MKGRWAAPGGVSGQPLPNCTEDTQAIWGSVASVTRPSPQLTSLPEDGDAPPHLREPRHGKPEGHREPGRPRRVHVPHGQPAQGSGRAPGALSLPRPRCMTASGPRGMIPPPDLTSAGGQQWRSPKVPCGENSERGREEDRGRERRTGRDLESCADGTRSCAAVGEARGDAVDTGHRAALLPSGQAPEMRVP